MTSRELDPGVEAARQSVTVAEWLRGQRVCVTGGRGALGRRLVRRLALAGVERLVAIDASPETVPAVGTAAAVPDGAAATPVEHSRGDLFESAAVERALDGATVVFHLAALVHVGRSAVDPRRYFEVNDGGTVAVLEGCRRLGVGQVVYTSTSHVYGRSERLPVDEASVTRPLSIYAASKLAGEAAIQGYSVAFGLTGTIARLSNLYGASAAPDTVIGMALTQALAGGPIALRDLTPVRDFVHADDVVEALIRLAAATSGQSGSTVTNVASGRPTSIRVVAESLADVMAARESGRPAIAEPDQLSRDPVPELVIAIDRLRDVTGWTPQLDLEEGLRRLVAEFGNASATSMTAGPVHQPGNSLAPGEQR